MFNGQLNSNEIFSALFNMIISQQVFADNVKGTYSALVDKARVDGSLYGDTKLFYATDALKSVEWLNDEECLNLLALDRPAAPKTQKIVLDKFRQIRLTVDDYLSKRAWGTEGAFAGFTSVMKGWIRDTKRIYDSTLYNAYVGTTETAEGKQADEARMKEGDNLGLTVAEKLANIMTEPKDVPRDHNDDGYIRCYAEGDLMVIWNSEVYNAIKKIDLPVVFHKEGLLDEFDQDVLPAKYFGQVNQEEATGDKDGTVRSLIEQTVEGVHYFPGEAIANGVSAPAGTTYTVDNSIAFKVIHKRSIPYMSAFEVGTSFFNPRSLTTNHYLTFGHNTIDYLKNYPLITVRTVKA
jgi:hypothetical protein